MFFQAAMQKVKLYEANCTESWLVSHVCFLCLWHDLSDNTTCWDGLKHGWNMFFNMLQLVYPQLRLHWSQRWSSKLRIRRITRSDGIDPEYGRNKFRRLKEDYRWAQSTWALEKRAAEDGDLKLGRLQPVLEPFLVQQVCRPLIGYIIYLCG